MYLIEQFINGLSLGGLYALIAVGFSMVYGVLKLLNFAHSEIITIGAYSGLIIATSLLHLEKVTLWSLLLLIVLSASISGIAAVLLYFLGYKSIYKKSRIAVLITAIGFSVIIQNILKLIFGSKSLAFLPVSDALNMNTVVFVVLTISFLSIYLLLKKTDIGIWIRAVADDDKTADLMGINSQLIVITVFFLGGFLAGVAGIIMGLRDGFVNPYMGFTPGLKAFSIAVVGSIGNLKGAVIVGLLLGLFEVMVQSLLPGEYSQLRDILAFAFLLLILIFNPTGLFGKKMI
ncbi:MAG: branched-chain amino acid ABC transporter permease [Chlorobi bacterium]|nr:branched-chain amino acid ABC transporter permease [Chlorobiota bacterium]